MGDRWDVRTGPPDAAYSRVTRDLAAVTAPLRAYVDALPARLAASYRCSLREPEVSGLARLGAGHHAPERVWQMAPPAPSASASLLMASSTFEGGTRVGVVAGRTVAETVPTCFCDACDETGEDMVEMVERIVQTVTGGFREYHRRDGGTWFTGHEAAGIGGSARGETYGPHAEPWVVDWQAWPLR